MTSTHSKNTSSGCVSRQVHDEVRDARKVHHTAAAKSARQQRVEDHRNGVDHGVGCVHCDVTHGR